MIGSGAPGAKRVGEVAFGGRSDGASDGAASDGPFTGGPARGWAR